MTFRFCLFFVVTWLIWLAALPLGGGVLAQDASQASEKPVIEWHFKDLPPAHVFNGADRRQGFADRTVAYFIDRLPAYRHVILEVPHSRLITELRRTDGVCSATILKTPDREKDIVFSKPVFKIFPLRLVLLKDKVAAIAPFMNDDDEVDLPQLIRNGSFRLGLISSRSYGTRMDTLLHMVNAKDKAFISPYERFAPMMARGRFDITLAYPFEAGYQFKSLTNHVPYATLAISGENQFTEVGLSCAKTPLGERVIADVDRIVEAEGVAPAYAAFYEEWLDDRAREEYRAVLDTN